MRYYDELTVRQIAAMLDVSIFTVYTRLHTGLKKLKVIYERWEQKNEKRL